MKTQISYSDYGQQYAADSMFGTLMLFVAFGNHGIQDARAKK